MIEFVWAKLFSKAVDAAAKRLAKVRFEVSSFSAQIEGSAVERSDYGIVVTFDPFAPPQGDLDISTDGAFFYDGEGATALSQFSFAFKAIDADKTKSVMAEATAVVSYPDGRGGKGDWSNRINLPSRRFVEVHFRSSVPKMALTSLDGCNSLYISAMMGVKKRKAWKVAEKRDGKWVGAVVV